MGLNVLVSDDEAEIFVPLKSVIEKIQMAVNNRSEAVIDLEFSSAFYTCNFFTARNFTLPGNKSGSYIPINLVLQGISGYTGRLEHGTSTGDRIIRLYLTKENQN